MSDLKFAAQQILADWDSVDPNAQVPDEINVNEHWDALRDAIDRLSAEDAAAEKPIDEEWLLSIGGKNQRPGRLYHGISLGESSVVLFFSDQYLDEVEVDVGDVSHIKTRGQLLDLLAALGIAIP